MNYKILYTPDHGFFIVLFQVTVKLHDKTLKTVNVWELEVKTREEE